MKLFAQIISWVFLPLFMPIYALLILMFIPSREDFLINDDSLYYLPYQNKIAVLIIYFIFSILAPGLTLLALKSRGIVSTIDIDDRKERLVPLLITALYCLILFLFFIFKASNAYLPKYIFALPLAGFITISLFAWINMYTKISLHACGAGILTGLIFAYCANSIYFNFSLLMIAVFITGFVLSARMYLNKHTLHQVLYGFGGSALIVFFINFFYPTGY
jgi:protein-S-isoprenylcysteine O-methyltransferase Ste14|tara:strand:- start:36124 stop:36780 length:657 start_codon:yes stop_codon:yes gene_type:complete